MYWANYASWKVVACPPNHAGRLWEHSLSPSVRFPTAVAPVSPPLVEQLNARDDIETDTESNNAGDYLDYLKIKYFIERYSTRRVGMRLLAEGRRRDKGSTIDSLKTKRRWLEL